MIDIKQYNWIVKYIRRPRISRAWGKKTKIHRLYLVFATRDEAQTVYRYKQQNKHHLDSVFLKRTDKLPSGILVEDARSLWRWKEL